MGGGGGIAGIVLGGIAFLICCGSVAFCWYRRNQPERGMTKLSRADTKPLPEGGPKSSVIGWHAEWQAVKWKEKRERWFTPSEKEKYASSLDYAGGRSPSVLGVPPLALKGACATPTPGGGGVHKKSTQMALPISSQPPLPPHGTMAAGLTGWRGPGGGLDAVVHQAAAMESFDEDAEDVVAPEASFERRRGAHRLTAHGTPMGAALGSISVDGGRMTEEVSSGGGSCAVTPPMANTPPIEGGGIRLFRI